MYIPVKHTGNGSPNVFALLPDNPTRSLYDCTPNVLVQHALILGSICHTPMFRRCVSFAIALDSNSTVRSPACILQSLFLLLPHTLARISIPTANCTPTVIASSNPALSRHTRTHREVNQYHIMHMNTIPAVLISPPAAAGIEAPSDGAPVVLRCLTTYMIVCWQPRRSVILNNRRRSPTVRPCFRNDYFDRTVQTLECECGEVWFPISTL